MQFALIHNFDGTESKINLTSLSCGDVLYTQIDEKIDYTKVKSIDYFNDEFFCKAGDDGYFVVPHGREQADSFICFLKNRENDEFVAQGGIMPIFGVKKGDGAILGIITGMRFSYDLYVTVKDNVYYMYQKFNINGKIPEEKIKIEYHTLYGRDASYSGIARKYREYQLEKGECIPIKERIKDNPYLKYSAESIYVRIRHAWKPAPSPVEEQTVENEPEMTVACSFKEAERLLCEMKSAGIDKAEICSVGWNKSGHDGRWPDSFPVEQKLGGETDFKEYIESGKALGYQMTCHTNQTDAYSIAERWDGGKYIGHNDNGELMKICSYSGGMCYSYKPEAGLMCAKQDFPRLRELGLCGLHYMDVISIINPREGVYNGKYMSAREGAMWHNEILKYGREVFGGAASEGGFDYVSKNLDFCLYVSFETTKPALCDRKIPLWQLVYHGIILSNPYSLCINPTIKSEDAFLKLIEYGGRPSFYLYSNFYKTSAWMGEEDLFCKTEEETKRSVEAIKKAYDIYQSQSYLQYEFMEEHREISDNVFEVVYSDGTVVRLDYNRKKYTLDKDTEI